MTKKKKKKTLAMILSPGPESNSLKINSTSEDCADARHMRSGDILPSCFPGFMQAKLSWVTG
jgi:hypothetical protein